MTEAEQFLTDLEAKAKEATLEEWREGIAILPDGSLDDAATKQVHDALPQGAVIQYSKGLMVYRCKENKHQRSHYERVQDEEV